MSFHSFYLISEIKRNVSYPQVFINVLQSLSHDYCESWAAAFLRTKIEPLRELLQIEQYDLTNEVRQEILVQNMIASTCCLLTSISCRNGLHVTKAGPNKSL